MLQVLQVDFVVFPLETVGEFVFSEAQAFFLWMPQCTKVRGGRRSGWDWFPSRCPEVSNWRMKLATLSSGVGCKWRCSSRAWSWYGPGAAMLAGLHPFYCYLLIFFGRFFSVWTKIGGKHLAPLINCLSGEKKTDDTWGRFAPLPWSNLSPNLRRRRWDWLQMGMKWEIDSLTLIHFESPARVQA